MSSTAHRVIHIGPCHLEIPAPRGGAVERRMWELARLQSRRGRKALVCSVGGLDSEEVIDGVSVHKIRLNSQGHLRSFEFLRKCRERTRGLEGVFHFHSVPEGAWLFRDSNNPTLLNFDNYFFRRGRKTPLFFLYRLWLQKFDLLVPVSQYCSSCAARYWRLPEDRFRVTYNGVNLEQFRPTAELRAEFRRSHGLTDSTVLVYAGRVNEQKGTDTLIDSYSQLRQRFPDLRLLVCGPAGQFHLTGENDLTKRIVQSGGLYLGAVSENDLVGLYNAADVFVLPTRELEMFGMVAAEAQACGVPVVASDNGGLPEVVGSGSGVLFKAGSPESLTSVLSSLLNDRKRLQALQLRARDNVKKFSWESICDDLEVAYALAEQKRSLASNGRY